MCIRDRCKTLGISVQQVEKSDYGQKLGAIAVSYTHLIVD